MFNLNTGLSNESFNIPDIVQALREVRLTSLEHRHRRNNPPKLPSRRALQEVVDGLSAAIFPNRLGTPGLKEEGVDYFVGYTLCDGCHAQGARFTFCRHRYRKSQCTVV